MNITTERPVLAERLLVDCSTCGRNYVVWIMPGDVHNRAWDCPTCRKWWENNQP